MNKHIRIFGCMKCLTKHYCLFTLIEKDRHYEDIKPTQCPLGKEGFLWGPLTEEVQKGIVRIDLGGLKEKEELKEKPKVEK